MCGGPPAAGAVGAENLEPAYLAINPNGTVPSLVVEEPGSSGRKTTTLVDTRPILEYIDSLDVGGSGSGAKLVPTAPAAEAERVTALIAAVHADALSTNIPLLMVRDRGELEAKRAAGIGEFVGKRQEVIERNLRTEPENPAYRERVVGNKAL